MWKILAVIQKNLVWAIPIVMILGISSGSIFDMRFLKITIVPLTFLMVYPMMINLKLEAVLSPKELKAQIVAQFLNFAVIPFIAFFLGKLFFPEQPLIRLGILFVALLPTSGMTISWTGFAKGNINAAIQMTVFGLILGSIATPLYAKWLMGKSIEIPVQQVFTSIMFVVFLPMFMGLVTRKYLVKKFGQEHYQKNIKPKVPMFSTLGVLGIVFVAMALKAKSITAEPTVLISYLTPIIILYVINFALSTIVAKVFFNREDAIAVVYGTVMRNLSIALAIAMTVFGESGAEISIVIAMAYIIQVQAAAWYVKLSDRIFGQKV
ncbi:arsenic resistance protein [Phocoenobacter skyensis]|uniref:Arsenite efflux pump ArsB, ACR3 family n=1 Tax=Phocoenobacter skyensis TaxID=97481 RepID=A0A1H7YDY0_9PAST|nr:bile acid:sodium symporter [Pasteurella skyensis]MDP8079724.1 bile acid:sodium symporter [Pasteurella skyensis]MDP8085701.1 bile acid:sodium symporter [Pasteurella skyensis]MDP8185470.1 bile acid:sodium symporter [Pasteurella skyensis]QLB22303.1 arsenite transporter [Pasteurella skyensis]SEM44074.1 Arsenite efflux pump ArsB, ACR3 family [Pasteurella skyensis]